jgi:hypothetical protein
MIFISIVGYAKYFIVYYIVVRMSTHYPVLQGITRNITQVWPTRNC